MLDLSAYFMSRASWTGLTDDPLKLGLGRRQRGVLVVGVEIGEGRQGVAFSCGQLERKCVRVCCVVEGT